MGRTRGENGLNWEPFSCNMLSFFTTEPMNKIARTSALIIFPVLVFWLGVNIGIMQGRSADGGIKIESTSGSTLTTQQVTSTKTSINDVDFATFWEVWQRLRKAHPHGGEISDKKMMEGAIKGIASSLDDPYTYYLTAEESDEFIHTDLNGEVSGIGAELKEGDAGVLTIVSIIPNSPAQKAGLLPGDIIYKINGEVQSNVSLYEAVKKIRGAKGTEVTLTIVRKDEEEAAEYKLMRDDIKVPSVTYETKEGGAVGFIKLNKFSESTGAELLSVAQKVLLTPPKALILDLRDNSGGYLDAAVDVVSIFNERGVVVSMKESDKEPKVYEVNGRARLQSFPMVVLVNEQSASAAEIVAGALKETGRGYLIGQHTYGKGSVQELESLADGSSLRITIAKWFTPSGFNVMTETDGLPGIHPDMKVEMTNADRKANRDPQLDSAIKYLKEKVQW